MIDPIIFSLEKYGIPIVLRWYGVIVMIGVIVGSLIIERELKRRGENSDRIWDALIWVLPIGIIGARLWFVLNATLGGDARYANNPVEIIKIWNGGLHIFGGFLFGGAALLYFLRQNKLDTWLFLDAAGPAMLIGQGIGRVANFINQELYGPPTTLPWGIPISAEHRLLQYSDLSKYPVETTRFHPTFAYEMLWNFATAGLLLWISRCYEKQIKPGTIFAGWLLAAGIGRAWIEFFRPDQPKIPGLGVSYSMVVSALMAIVGAILLMARYKAINIALAETWEEEYQISGGATVSPETVEEDQPGDEIEEKPVRVKRARKTVMKSEDSDEVEAVRKPVPRKTAAAGEKKKSTG